MGSFDRFVFVDWSANSKRKTGKDSIWIAEKSAESDVTLSNPSTRDAATRHLAQLLRKAVERKQRVLVGFDFAYSYPLAVLRHLASSQGPSDFVALWQALHSQIDDRSDNSNDRLRLRSMGERTLVQGPVFLGLSYSVARASLAAGHEERDRSPRVPINGSCLPRCSTHEKARLRRLGGITSSARNASVARTTN